MNKEFLRTLKEVEGNITLEQAKIAYIKFINSREWDKLHPVYDMSKPIKKIEKLTFLERIFGEVKGKYKPVSPTAYEVKNPILADNKLGYMAFFKAYNKFAKNKNNAHLNLSLVKE